jgi:quercetin dioxygenase-like cupin family protein
MTNDQPLAKAGETIHVRSPGAALTLSHKLLLVKTTNVELTQLIIPAGTRIPTHEARGEIVVHCLAGHVALRAINAEHELRPGQLLYLSTNEPFSIQGIEDSSLLLTIILPKQGANVEFIGG